MPTARWGSAAPTSWICRVAVCPAAVQDERSTMADAPTSSAAPSAHLDVAGRARCPAGAAGTRRRKPSGPTRAPSSPPAAGSRCPLQVHGGPHGPHHHRRHQVAGDGRRRLTPNSRISIGVISAPPPAPVMPTSTRPRRCRARCTDRCAWFPPGRPLARLPCMHYLNM